MSKKIGIICFLKILYPQQFENIVFDKKELINKNNIDLLVNIMNDFNKQDIDLLKSFPYYYVDTDFQSVLEKTCNFIIEKVQKKNNTNFTYINSSEGFSFLKGIINLDISDALFIYEKYTSIKSQYFFDSNLTVLTRNSFIDLFNTTKQLYFNDSVEYNFNLDPIFKEIISNNKNSIYLPIIDKLNQIGDIDTISFIINKLKINKFSLSSIREEVKEFDKEDDVLTVQDNIDLINSIPVSVNINNPTETEKQITMKYTHVDEIETLDNNKYYQDFSISNIVGNISQEDFNNVIRPYIGEILFKKIKSENKKLSDVYNVYEASGYIVINSYHKLKSLKIFPFTEYGSTRNLFYYIFKNDDLKNKFISFIFTNTHYICQNFKDYESDMFVFLEKNSSSKKSK